MTQIAKNFNEVVNFTRGTGATRVNAADLIVGVDFSSTSITFGTGPRAFTLTADANVNRDWLIGSSLRAVSQAAPLGELVGTVTAYDPATQLLTMNVVTSTGTGTAINWRIGSLEARRDAKGILQEPQVSSVLSGSKNLNGYGVAGALTLNSITGPDGSLSMHLLKDNGTAPVVSRSYTPAKLGVHTMAFCVKAGPALAANRVLRFRPNNNASQGANNFVFMNLLTGAILDNASNRRIVVESRPNGVFFVRCVMDVAGIAAGTFAVGLAESNLGAGAVPSDGVSDFYLSDIEYHDAEWTSSIPTTTIAVTRAADSFASTALSLAALRQGEGTLIIEAETDDNGTAQKRPLLLTGPSGDIRVAKRGAQTQTFTKMADGGGRLVVGVTAGSSLTDNGKVTGPLTVALNDRTGLPETVGLANAFAFNGSNQFGYVTTNEERLLASDLSLWSGRGLGGFNLTGAHHNGSRFLIASATTGVVGSSIDGLSYRRINTAVLTQPTNEITSGLVGGITRNVIVGNAGFIATNDEPTDTWISRISGVATNFNACAFGVDTYVAVNATAANSRYSIDGGVTWLAVTGLTGTMIDVIYTGAQFVAINTVGGVFTSANGQAFTAVTTTGITPAFATANGIAFATIGGQGYYVIVGNGGQVAVSVAAANASPATYITYTSGGTPATTTTQQLNEALSFNNKFYLVGNTQTVVEFDPVTVTFVSRTANVSSNLAGIAASPTRLIITGSAGALTSSINGITYESRTNNSITLNSIVFANGRYISVGNNVGGSGYVATIDADGTVTRRVFPAATNCNSIKLLDGVLYIATQAGDGIYRSTDNGETWVALTGAATPHSDIAFGNGVYLAVRNTNSGALVRSTDGLSFVVVQSGITIVRNAITFANGIFVAVGAAGNITTTTDGLTYVNRVSGTTQTLTSVIFSTVYNAWIVAGANGTMLISYDNAVTWQPIGNAAFGAIDNNGIQANPNGPLWVNGMNKIALSYKNNEVKLSINGSVPRVDTLASIPTITSILFGDNFNGYIKRVQIKPLAVDPQAETV